MSENNPSIHQQSGLPYIFSSSANNVYFFIQCAWFSLHIERCLLMMSKWSWWSVFHTINVAKVKYQCTNTHNRMESHNDDHVVIFLVYFPFLRRGTYVSYHLSTFDSMDQFLWIWYNFDAVGGHPITLLKVLQSVIMTVTCTNLWIGGNITNHHIYSPQVMYINSSLKYVPFFRVILCSIQSSNIRDIKMFLSLLVWWHHLMIQ